MPAMVTARSPISAKSDRPIRPVRGPGEDDLLVRAVDGAPGADPTLQGPAQTRAELGMAPQNLLENRRPAAALAPPRGSARLTLPDIGERIGAAAFATDLPLRGKTRSFSIREALDELNPDLAAESALGRSDGTSCTAHLAVGDVAAGKGEILIGVKKLVPWPGRPRRQTARSSGARRRQCRSSGRADALPALRDQPCPSS